MGGGGEIQKESHTMVEWRNSTTKEFDETTEEGI